MVREPDMRLGRVTTARMGPFVLNDAVAAFFPLLQHEPDEIRLDYRAMMEKIRAASKNAGAGATKELPALAGVLVVGLVLLAISRRTAPSPGPRSSP